MKPDYINMAFPIHILCWLCDVFVHREMIYTVHCACNLIISLHSALPPAVFKKSELVQNGTLLTFLHVMEGTLQIHHLITVL
jgi:hypothetical protein